MNTRRQRSKPTSSLQFFFPPPLVFFFFPLLHLSIPHPTPTHMARRDQYRTDYFPTPIRPAPSSLSDPHPRSSRSLCPRVQFSRSPTRPTDDHPARTRVPADTTDRTPSSRPIRRRGADPPPGGAARPALGGRMGVGPSWPGRAGEGGGGAISGRRPWRS